MRVGRIGYINCYPVYRAIDDGVVDCPGDIVTGTPSELNNLLQAGQLDLSVVSAVEYARNAGAYHLLGDLAISCDGPVHSVALFSKRPWSDLDGKSVLVSASSKTSVYLLELLCAERWGVKPKFVEARAERQDLEALSGLPHDAVLVIGDAALILSASNVYPYSYDLGLEWKAWTGLPFVFAVWAARRDVDQGLAAQVHRALLESRDWGLNNLDSLVQQAVTDTGLSQDRLREYFSDLDYALSYRHIEGLTSFFRRLAQRGLVPEGTLSFLSVA
ncbi:MAG: menaquinone biosynthesis protein [Gemmatimonadota bacterium]|nr:menaquinone biosynthesis protein [Gemmatimonadota bacterium]MDH5803631.1 menaquinone biosynthesis protein [Gemmatimonadota bacterium]